MTAIGNIQQRCEYCGSYDISYSPQGIICHNPRCETNQPATIMYKDDTNKE